jgi:hypothetical protein
VGRSFAQQIANTWQVKVYASKKSFKFWKRQKEVVTRKDVWYWPWPIVDEREWVDVAPGEDVSGEKTRWVKYHGEDIEYGEDTHVEMFPYSLGGFLTIRSPNAYRRFDPSTN